MTVILSTHMQKSFISSKWLTNIKGPSQAPVEDERNFANGFNRSGSTPHPLLVHLYLPDPIVYGLYRDFGARKMPLSPLMHLVHPLAI